MLPIVTTIGSPIRRLQGPTLAFSRAAVVDRECLEHMIAPEIAAILLDAQRRRLERDVRPFPASTQIGANERGCLDKAS